MKQKKRSERGQKVADSWNAPGAREKRLKAMSNNNSPIRTVRLAYGDSQAQWMKRLGLSPKCIEGSLWENGHKAAPEKHVKAIRLLAEKKGIPFDYKAPTKEESEPEEVEDLEIPFGDTPA